MGMKMDREEKRRVIFYGDSNTYGYDPADMLEGRYPAQVRWTEQVAGRLGEKWEVIAQGLNGRKLPDRRYDFQRILEMIEPLGERDVFAVMLGTNDILITPDAQVTMNRMNRLIELLKTRLDGRQILILAPVWIGTEPVTDPLYRRYHQESKRMNAGFKTLAEKQQVLFQDTAGWQIRLAFDQVHFSEEGCVRFAERMAEVLEAM